MQAAERETIIQFDDANPGFVHVYTAQPSMIRKLAAHPKAVLVETHQDHSGRVTGAEYDLPRDCLAIRAGKRRVSEAQREAARRRAAVMMAARQSTTVPRMASSLQNQDLELGSRGVTALGGARVPAQSTATARSQKRPRVAGEEAGIPIFPETQP